MKKKFLLTLSLIAIMTVLFAISVSAAEPVEVIDISKNNDGSVMAYFYYSEKYLNVTENGVYKKWYLYTLTVTGEGEMRDFWDSEWSIMIDRTYTVKIENGVTNIGNGAFAYSSHLTNVVISDSVTSIGVSAFECCNNLTSVVIPDSVEFIGGCAFYSCCGLNIYCEAESKPAGWDSNIYCEDCYQCGSNCIRITWGYSPKEVSAENVFAFKGYSFGFAGQIAVGFDIDYVVKARYEEKTGKTLEIGVLFTGFDNLKGEHPLDAKGQAIALNVGKVIKADLTTFNYPRYDFILNDIEESLGNIKLVIAAYMYDGDVVKYVQENGISDTVSGISYNEAKESKAK